MVVLFITPRSVVFLREDGYRRGMAPGDDWVPRRRRGQDEWDWGGKQQEGTIETYLSTAATATTTAAAIAAAATAAAAAAAAATATAAATASAIRTLLRLVHDDGATIELTAVPGRDGLLGVCGAAHLDEREATRLSGVSVRDDLDLHDRSVLAERGAQSLLRGVE
jgi:hypothetical protein